MPYSNLTGIIIIFINSQNMSFDSSSHRENKKAYLKYDLNMRLKLIKLVEEEKMSTAQAGRRVGIKQTSACRIMHCFRKYGHIFQKKSDREQRITSGDREIPQNLIGTAPENSQKRAHNEKKESQAQEISKKEEEKDQQLMMASENFRVDNPSNTLSHNQNFGLSVNYQIPSSFFYYPGPYFYPYPGYY